MSLTAVSLPPTDLPGMVEQQQPPLVQRRDASTHHHTISLQHPLPTPHPLNHTGPHQPQHWAQPLHPHTLQPLHLPPATTGPLPPRVGHPPTYHPPPHLQAPLPLLRPEPHPLSTLTSLLTSPSPFRPSPFLLSLHIGDEVDALDEIGYRQWRHAYILELGHIPGQTIHDSGRVGEYKIRWKGWDAKWDEFVHGGRLAPLNSRVIGDTGPEALSEKESAVRVGKEWRRARQAGSMTDVAITYQPDAALPSAAAPHHSPSSSAHSLHHHRSLSSDDVQGTPLMLAHLALLSVRCPSLLSFFTDHTAADHPPHSTHTISYQLHPHSDSHPTTLPPSSSPTPHHHGTTLGSLDNDEQTTAIPPPTSARLHSDLEGGGWRRGRLSTPAGRGGVEGATLLSIDSPLSARPATADASTTRSGPTHHSSTSLPTQPRRSLNFSHVTAASAAPPSSAARAPVHRGRSHLTPTVPSLSASAPTSPLTVKDEPPTTPPVLTSTRAKVDRWSAEPSDDLLREVSATVDAMTSAVALVQSISGQVEEYSSAEDYEEGERKEKEEKKEEGGGGGGRYTPLSPSPPPTPGQLIPVFCVPGIRSYAGLRAFVEFVYTDAFDGSVKAGGGGGGKGKGMRDGGGGGGGVGGGEDRVGRVRHMREVGVGVGVGEGEDSDEERLGLMDPDLDGIDDDLLHSAIAARYGRHLASLASSHHPLPPHPPLNSDPTDDDDETTDADPSPPNPAHVLSMSDLFDLACIGSRFHFPRLIALCASHLSDVLSVENVMEALQLCVRVGCLGGDEEEDILASIFSSSSSSLLPPSSIAPPSSSSLPSHRVHDLSILLRIAFDFLSHHWDVVMKRDTSVKILHTLPFPAFSAVVQVKGRSVNSTHGSARYTPPVVHHPASRLVRDIKQLYLQRGPPPASSSTSSSSSSSSASTSCAPLLLPSASCFRFPACDFQIVVGDSVHWAHRSVLACRSEYFRALFTSRMQESVVSSITFPLSQHSPDSVATLLRYLYYDDVGGISYEAALYLLHHCTDFFGLANNHLEAACEQLIMQECEGNNAAQQPPADGDREEGERRVGLADVVRMSWRMSKWPLFERAVKFLDWAGLESLINQTYATAPSPFSSITPLSHRSSAVHSSASSPHGATPLSRGGAFTPTTPAASEEKSNCDSVRLLSSASSSSTAAPSPVLALQMQFDLELVRAVVAEKARPGVTMRERGGGGAVAFDAGGTAMPAAREGEDSGEYSRRDRLRIEGVGLLRRGRREEEDDDEVEEEEGIGGMEEDDGDLEDDDDRGDADLDDEDDVDGH